MPRAIRHYLRGYVSPITYPCLKVEFLLKFDQDQRRRVRLPSAIECVSPRGELEGSEREIFAERGRKMEATRELRQQRPQELIERMGEKNCRPVASVLN